MQPVPFWESPTSFHLTPSSTDMAAVAETGAAPLPIPMPTQQNGGDVGAFILAAAAASVSEAGSAFDRASNVRDYPRSLPIVLSPSFLSSEDDEDEEGSSEVDAAVDALMDEEAAAGSAESEDTPEEEAKPGMQVGNGGSLTPRRLLSRSSFSRTRSNSFNSSMSAGERPSLGTQHGTLFLDGHYSFVATLCKGAYQAESRCLFLHRDGHWLLMHLNQ